MEILLISILLGFITGLVLALTGAGGTVIAIPLLMFGLHLVIAEAAPIALLAIGLSSAAGAMYAHRQGKVRYRAAGFLAMTGIITAPVGIWLAHKLPNAPVTILFALILFYIALDMWYQSKKHQDEKAISVSDCQSEAAAIPCRLEYKQGRLIWTWSCARALAFAGILVGFLSGLLGVGGGFVIVPALKKATNLPMESILATSLAAIALISAIGVIYAILIDGMNWSIALPFVTGALIGMLIGRTVASHLAGPRLQQGFAVVAMAVSVGMVIRLCLMTD